VVRGHHVGSMGRVIASRNGYLVVQLSTGRSAYFRGKDLQRIKGSQVEAVPKAWSRAVSTSVPDAAVHGQTHPRSHTQLGSGRQGPSRSSHTARVSWRDNALGSDEEDEQDVVQQHEHAYARAIKMDPTALADVVARVERLLPLHTPEGTVHSAIEPEYTDESVRLHSPVEGEWPQLNLFQERWRRGEPVVLMDLQKRLGRKWGPHGFLQRFGAESVQMIDCRDGKSVHWLSLAHFFAGYLQPWTRALCPDTFRRMMLKLKDWPPDQDFKAKLPEYFDDLMEALPFPQYTRRDGVLNLAKYFPREYVPPDLGPKMYNAYGRQSAWSGMDPKTKKGGHTNLHCDVADAVNVMVDVAVDEDKEESGDENDEKLLLHDEELGDLGKQHGAVWDIFRWEDSDAILQLLHAVARERDVEITSNPIHDQLFYLDASLRRRLRDDYGVRGWRFIQRHGDAVFIPAGCPHQVRNLSSCIKVALDFVSPENAHRCVTLTNEFAKLPRGHQLSEDKLQVKTMLLHAMSHITEALLSDEKR